jgi:hypothetical protein
MSTPSIPATLTAIHTALSNLQADAVLHTPLAAYGYDAAAITSLVTLYENAAASHFAHITQYAEYYGAVAAYETAHAAAHTAYIRHLTLARVAYEHQVGRHVQLGLSGKRQRTHDGWQLQAEQFYTAALKDPIIQAELATVGITLASLQAVQGMVEGVAAAWHAKEKEYGEALAATQTRNAALKTLQDAYSNLIVVARVAFADDLQKLERMGIVVK